MNIIQVGTNKAYDHLSDIVKSYKPEKINNIILVEPFTYHNSSILDCYKKYQNKLFIENIIITPNNHHEKQEKIWYHELDTKHSNAYELASLNPSHAHNIRNNYQIADMKYNLMDCYTINELFDKYHLSNIDILAIDTEGFDDQIIYSLDFKKYNITTIFYEHLHIDKYAIWDFLKNRDYEIEHAIPIDPYTDKATKK